MIDITRTRRASRSMDLTPLIDVVFLLIVFFMLSTSFVVSESMELSIPSEGAKQAGAADVWVLQVEADGLVTLDGESLKPEALRARVKDALAQNAEQKILLLAKESTTVQQLVNVLDMLYLQGARKVQIDKLSSALTPQPEAPVP